MWMRSGMLLVAVGLLTVPAFAQAEQFGHVAESAGRSRLPLYPNAAEKPEKNVDPQGHRGTVSAEVSVGYLSGGQYVSSDSPDKVLNYYREQMKSYGAVTQCEGGTNLKVDIQLDEKVLSNPTACYPGKIGAEGIELKVSHDGEQHIVLVEARGSGSEFALVNVRAR